MLNNIIRIVERFKVFGELDEGQCFPVTRHCFIQSLFALVQPFIGEGKGTFVWVARMPDGQTGTKCGYTWEGSWYTLFNLLQEVFQSSDVSTRHQNNKLVTPPPTHERTLR